MTGAWSLNVKNRKPDRRRIKTHSVYSIAEAAERLSVSANTIRNWLDKGLPHFRPHKEILIHGGDLKDFLAKREHNRKRPCPQGSMYCFKCRTPRFPPPELVEIASTGSSLNLRGLCPSCCGLMFLKVSKSGVEAAGFASLTKHACDHLMDSPQPCLN